jgi:hypothetical protein
LSVLQSTIANNSAIGDGGGLKIVGTPAVAKIHNSTIAGNVARVAGGGISSSAASAVEVISTIIAKNSVKTKGATDLDLAGSFAIDFSLIGVLDSATIEGADNLTGVDPKLGKLRNNGGPTFTMLPAAGSPALGAGANPDSLATDQRGVVRPATGVDIGAVEV